MDLPVRAIREQVASAIDVIVQISRLRDGSRRITHVTEVAGMEGQVVTLQDVFTFDYDGRPGRGREVPRDPTAHGHPSHFVERLQQYGIDIPAASSERQDPELSMNRAILLAALALTCLVGVQAGAASAQDVSGLRIDRVDVAGHPDVRVTVSAPASGGDDSFAIVEDGEDRAFTVEDASSADLQVVLLLDVTGSMGGGALDAAKDAAIAFLEGLPDEANVAVVSYDTDAEVVSGFDGTRDEHVTAIEALEAAGETAMYDAVVTALDVFPATEDATRALVLLTDGEDNASVTELDTVIDRLSSSGVLLRGVEYQTAYSETAGIRAMAEATGGDVVEADDPGALVGVYERLAAELTNRYTLSYGSKAAGTVELTVELTSGDETARASQRIELPAAPRVTEDRVDEEPIEAVVPPPSVEPAEPSTRVVTYTWLIVGALLFFAGLAGMLVILFSPRARRAQLAGSAARISRGRGSASRGRWSGDPRHRAGAGAAWLRAGAQRRPGACRHRPASRGVRRRRRSARDGVQSRSACC
jgi:hypothetical protein